MSPLNLIITTVLLLALQSVTKSEGAGTITISVTPVIVKEFTAYVIRCQYPPPAVNASTTGVLQVTHVSPSGDVILYKYDFDGSAETFPNEIQMRATASLNKTLAVVVINVQVSYSTDSGLYSCSLVDAPNNISLTATSPVALNVSGCVGGSQLDSIIGCPSASVGLSCSVFCNSSVANATVSLSRNNDGSSVIASDLNEVNYTINSVQNSDLGNYFCYVRTPSCISMASTSVSPAPATTAPPGCASGGCGGGGRRLPGWGIALIVIACVICVAIIVAIIIFLLHKKGFLKREKGESGVSPASGGRTVANDNYAMSHAKSAGGKNGKSSAEGNGSAAVVSFPEVKSRKSQLPPLEPMTQGWNRRQAEEDSPDVAKRRPLPKKDENASPETERHRRSNQGRRQSDDEGDSPERNGGRLPPIRLSSHRERDQEEEDEHRSGRF